MTPRLFVRRSARIDIETAFLWYEERVSGLGHRFLHSVRTVLQAIESAPQQFPVVFDDIRKAQLRRFPYLIYFVIHKRGISVIAVIHGSRDPRRWRKRR